MNTYKKRKTLRVSPAETLRERQSPAEGNPPAALVSPHPALRAPLTPGATTGGTPATHWLSLLRRGG